LKEIGAYFGIHYTTVSGFIKNHKSMYDSPLSVKPV
jgi:hypothetical protein